MAGNSLRTDSILTVLAGLLETRQQINLHICVVGILRELNLAPGLRPRPPSRLPVAENLLLEVDDLEVRGYSFKAIRLINMGIDVLQGVQRLLDILRVVAMFLLLAQNMGFQVEQGTSVLFTVNGALRDELWWYRVQSFLDQYEIILVSFTEPKRSLHLQEPHRVVDDSEHGLLIVSGIDWIFARPLTSQKSFLSSLSK